MKGLTIAEVEDSYLNFFTPALMCAAGLFLINMISNSLSLYGWITEVDFNTFNYIISIFAGILVFFIGTKIMIPNLKIEDADYKKPNKSGLLLVILIFSVVITIRILLGSLFDNFGKIEIYTPWYVNTYTELFDPALLTIFLVNRLLISGIVSVILYQRILIPLLEDRGLSPFFSILLVSVSYAMLDIPFYIQHSEIMNSVFWFSSTFLYSFATGIIYVLTRNIAYSILYGTFYQLYKIINEIAIILEDPLFVSLYEVLDEFLLIFCILNVFLFVIISPKLPAISEWRKILSKKSYGLVNKGIIGYFLIAFYLIAIQFIIDNLREGISEISAPIYLFFTASFYLFAFSIPWWLSISTEYAQDIE